MKTTQYTTKNSFTKADIFNEAVIELEDIMQEMSK